MCGISGIVNLTNLQVSTSEMQSMNDLIKHRGPDGEGFYFDKNFALGHRRLAIIDLTVDGNQPMIYHNKNVITYNGEIYNYIEIRDELMELGYTFNSKSDTEVILAAYSHWGEDCVTRFNGMWSFALFDYQKNILFCSRDRFGVKPFYYVVSDNKFIFGSEIKQLLPFISQIKCNSTVLLDYLLLGIEEHSNATFFEEVLKLEQGSNLIYDLNNHTFEIKKYYQISINHSLSKLSEKESIERYKAKLNSAVTIRMRSDVQVGTCLSGGLDSSSITSISSAILKDLGGKSIKAIHAKATEKNIDESEFAKEVAEYCGASLEIIEPTSADFKKVLDKVIYIQEEPFGSPSVMMQYFVMQKAHQLNCTVMLDGQGGDESLLGYEKYYPAYLLQRKGFNKVIEFMQSSKNSKLSKLDLIKYYVYFTNYKIRLKRLKKRHSYLQKSIVTTFESDILKELSKKYLSIKSLQLLEISKTQLPHLLRYEDKNSMANSIETRLPFIDYRCVETALSINNDYKIKNGWTKYILRKAMAGKLPESILWRKNKLGFNAPEQTWLSDMQDEMLNTIKTSSILANLIDFDKLDYDKLDIKTKWRLFNISKWEKLYSVQH